MDTKMISTTEISEYYLKTAFENKREEQFVRHSDFTKIAVIIEPRFDIITEHVIYNFMHFLNPLGWNLLVISYSGYHHRIEQTLPYAFVFDIGDRHIIFDSNDKPNISIDSYNTILLDPELWKNVPGDTIILFQRDCIMFRMFSEHFLLYDYAGSNYLENLSPLFGGINGGFSIRKRATMLECLEKITWDIIHDYRLKNKHAKSCDTPIIKQNEDVFFTHACEILCKIVPDIYNRTFLCIENGFNPSTAVHHGWNKGYISAESLLFLLKSSPLFSQFPDYPH